MSWPDFGVPKSASAMLDFQAHVKQRQESSLRTLYPDWTGPPGGPPVVVHCSAGIGRTGDFLPSYLIAFLNRTTAFLQVLFFPSPSGTFCTLDICLSRLEDIGTVDIKQTVRRMRTQRAFSIQTWDQYYFCYKAVIEYAQQSGLLQPVEWSDTELETDSEWIRRNRTRTRGKEAVFSPLLATGRLHRRGRSGGCFCPATFQALLFILIQTRSEIVAWCMSCSIFLVLFFYKYWLAHVEWQTWNIQFIVLPALFYAHSVVEIQYRSTWGLNSHFYQKCKKHKTWIFFFFLSLSLRHIEIATSLCLNRFLSVVYFMVKLIFKPKVCCWMLGCIRNDRCDLNPCISCNIHLYNVHNNLWKALF